MARKKTGSKKMKKSISKSIKHARRAGNKLKASKVKKLVYHSVNHKKHRR